MIEQVYFSNSVRFFAEMIAERYRVRLRYTLTEVTEEKAYNDYNIDKLIEWLKIERNGYTQKLIAKYC